MLQKMCKYIAESRYYLTMANMITDSSRYVYCRYLMEQD